MCYLMTVLLPVYRLCSAFSVNFIPAAMLAVVKVEYTNIWKYIENV
jgi:hypothetical protein